MRRRRTTCLFLTAALLCLAVADRGQARPQKTDPEEVAALRRQLVELQRRATVGEVEVARLRQELARLERELQAARQGCAGSDRGETPAAVEDLRTGPIDPGSGIEETELEEDEAAPDAGGEIEQGGEETGAATSGGPPPEPQSPEALSLYDEGYTLFHQQRYREAEERFRRYLTLFPRTELADNAQFWIGETHYARNDYAAALAAFTATVERYPEGNKIADALLKAGKCLEALGRIDQARETYHEVTDRFPSAAAAVIARERLAALP